MLGGQAIQHCHDFGLREICNWRWLRETLLREQALPLKPVCEPVDPMIHRKILLVHCEAVFALRVYV
jgi:hypothetical protein